MRRVVVAVLAAAGPAFLATGVSEASMSGPHLILIVMSVLAAGGLAGVTTPVKKNLSKMPIETSTLDGRSCCSGQWGR